MLITYTVYSDAALGKGRRLFDTEEEALEYSDDMCLDSARTAILLSLGRHGEAIESFVAAGQFLDAIKLLLKSGSPNWTRQAFTYIRQELWKLMPFGFRARNTKSDTITELLELSGKLKKSYLRPTERNEVCLFDQPRIAGADSFEIRLKCSTAYTRMMLQRFVNLEKYSSTSIIFLHLPTVLNSSIMGVFLLSKG